MSTRWTTEKVERLLDEAVRLNYVYTFIDEGGLQRYRLTDEGREHLEEFLQKLGRDPR